MNPVLRWMNGNAIIQMDAAGNRKFNKDKSREIVISLQNTVSSDEDKNSIYFLPVRIFQEYIFCGVSNANNDEAVFFLEKAQDYA